MLPKKKVHPKVKLELHPRNKHRQRYDFKALIATYPALAPFVAVNNFGDESIDFFNPEAVKALNTALLKHFYNLGFWDVPKGYLCPPIPGRADYIHYVADLLAEDLDEIPRGSAINILDIGTGANCIYPIIGHQEYGWHFVGSEIDFKALRTAKKIIDKNTSLEGAIELRLQKNPRDIFRGIINDDDRFAVTICNPPFHASQTEALKGTVRKIRNLKHSKEVTTERNFAGQSHELWCDGGEAQFVRNMIFESVHFGKNCRWFTTLISKESNLRGAFKTLKKVGAIRVKTIEMGQGNKTSRILVWSFLSEDKPQDWSDISSD